MRSVYACIVIPATVVVTVHTLYMCAGVCAQYCGLWLVLVKLRRHAREGERHGGVPGMYIHVHMHENVYIDCMTCGERHGGVPDMYVHVRMHENVYVDCTMCGGALDRWSGYVRACTCT